MSLLKREMIIFLPSLAATSWDEKTVSVSDNQFESRCYQVSLYASDTLPFTRQYDYGLIGSRLRVHICHSHTHNMNPVTPAGAVLLGGQTSRTDRDRLDIPKPNNLLLQEPREGGWAKSISKNNERDKRKSDHHLAELATIVSSLLRKQSSEQVY
jgi:hypothetical protein